MARTLVSTAHKATMTMIGPIPAGESGTHHGVHREMGGMKTLEHDTARRVDLLRGESEEDANHVADVGQPL